jgi:hypothetical protein
MKNRSHLSHEYERFWLNRSYLEKDVNDFDVFLACEEGRPLKIPRHFALSGWVCGVL